MQHTQKNMARPWWSKMVVYWLDDQVSITFHSDLPPTAGKDAIIASLNLDGLNQFLNMRGYNLRPFTQDDIPHVFNKSMPQEHLSEIAKRERGIERLERELTELERTGHRSTLFSSTLAAENEMYSTPREKAIEELKQKIDALEKEIADLEKTQNTSTGQNNGMSSGQNGMMSNEQGKQSTTSRRSRRAQNLHHPTGKYLFHQAAGQGSLIHCYFHIEQTTPYSMMGTPTMGGMGSGMSSMYGGMGSSSQGDTVRTVVNLINSNLDDLRHVGKVPVVAASPNWLSGGTPPGDGCGTHGCPQSPPVPVEDDSSIWHITLPELSADMQKRTGTGVTVFVLDTRPALAQVVDAAKRAGNNNALLQTMVEQMQGESPKFVFNDQDAMLPMILEDGSPEQPFTGRDICGRLCGYNVVDHGMFVSGIIRDVAPGAKIECIRVLNDYGVGTVAVLTQALEDIHNRMLPIDPTTNKEGDLHNKPVVINLSLVAVLHQEEMVSWWSGGSLDSSVLKTSDTEPLTLHLHSVLHSLAALGAVIVGAAGNDSDMRQCIPEHHPQMMIVSTQRMRPRFPAAFPEVLAVGAVDSSEHAAAYSNFPVAPGSAQNNGIATYGGGIPVPIFPQSMLDNPPPADGSPFDASTMTDVDRRKMDALVGVFTSPTYPALSADDVPHEYKAPNDNAWAYWSGTSFATPIISGVAARVLETLAESNLPPQLWHNEVMRAFTTVQGQQDRLVGSGSLSPQPEFSQGGVHVSLLNAKQISTTQAQQTGPQKAEATV